MKDCRDQTDIKASKQAIKRRLKDCPVEAKP